MAAADPYDVLRKPRAATAAPPPPAGYTLDPVGPTATAAPAVDPYDVLRVAPQGDPYDVLRTPIPPPPAGFTRDPVSRQAAPVPPVPAPPPGFMLDQAADPYDVLRTSASPSLQDRARQAQAEALALPGDVAGAVGRWIAKSDIGQIVATYGPPIGRVLVGARQAIEPAVHVVANLPGIAQVGQASRAVGHAAGYVLGSGGVEGLLTKAASALSGKPIESYDEMFQAQGVDPNGAHVLGALFRGTLQPSNLLAAPGAISKALGTGVAIARTGANIARATGLTEPAAQAVGTAGRLLTEGKLTGPIIKGISNTIVQAAPLLDKYAGTPPAFKQGIRQYFGDLRTGIGGALAHQQAILDAVPLEADRIVLARALVGSIPESSIPDRLLPAYRDIVYAGREATTTKALDSGVLLTARENYMRRYYPPEVMAAIRARALNPSLPATELETRLGIEPPHVRASPELGIEGATGRSGGVGGGPTQAQREARMGQILEAMPEEGRRSAFGRQVEPTRGLRGLTSGFQKQRVLSEDAATALGYTQDPAVALPAHQLEVDHAIANKNLYQRITELGPDWVRPDGPGVPTNWVGMQQIVGVGNAERYGWSALRVHPQIAAAVKDITGATDYRLAQALAIPGWMNGALKRVIFLTPTVHDANMIRGAYLERGWNILNPRYWQEVSSILQDAREMGPWEQMRLAAGGSIGGGGVSRQLDQAIDEIFSYGPAAGSLRQMGILGRAAASQEVARHVGPEFMPTALKRGAAFVRALNDEALWSLDRGGRLASFKWAFQEMAERYPEIPKEQVAQFAARYADRVWNDYSTVHYGPVEKVLNSLLFVYPWTRGRAQLFAALARSYLPSSAPDAFLYRRLAGRWAATNLVLPHIYRAWNDKQSAGFFAAKIPAGTFTDKNGNQRDIYISPTGWYNDAAAFLQDPGGFALARVNPGLKALGDVYALAKEGQRQGKNVTKALIQTIVPGAPGAILSDFYPAGATQMFTSQPVPLWARALTPLGVPTSLTGPPSENPRMQMQQMFDRGDYLQAGIFARQNGISLTQTLAQLPPGEPRRQFLRGYHGGNIPGMPKLPLPSLPRAP